MLLKIDKKRALANNNSNQVMSSTRSSAFGINLGLEPVKQFLNSENDLR